MSVRSVSSLASAWRDMPRSRATALAAVALIHLLILLVLLSLSPALSPRPGDPPGLITFQVFSPKAAPKAKPRVAKARPRTSAAKPPSPATTQVDLSSLLLPGLEHFDLSKIPARPAPAPETETAAAAGADSPSVPAPSGFPGDGRLYNAEWVREPTNAELSFYLPQRRQLGWGVIACQTAARFRVDNCRELGDSPPGSGLARAVSEAAWQFLVRPPRIDGKPLLGAWVRIRIDFTPAGAAPDGPDRSPG